MHERKWNIHPSTHEKRSRAPIQTKTLSVPLPVGKICASEVISPGNRKKNPVGVFFCLSVKVSCPHHPENVSASFPHLFTIVCPPAAFTRQALAASSAFFSSRLRSLCAPPHTIRLIFHAFSSLFFFFVRGARGLFAAIHVGLALGLDFFLVRAFSLCQALIVFLIPPISSSLVSCSESSFQICNRRSKKKV